MNSKTPLTSQYTITNEKSDKESICLEKICNYPQEEISTDSNSEEKKMSLSEFDPIFRDLRQDDKLLDKEEDDGFILTEFQLDQLDPLTLSPDGIMLSTDILPSSSQISSSNAHQIYSEYTTDLSNVYKSQTQLAVELSDPPNKCKSDGIDLKKETSALIDNVSLKRNKDNRSQCMKIKDKLSSLRRKKNSSSNVDKKVDGHQSNSNDNCTMTVVAISTNKISNMTQIVINNGKEEQIYEGKTTELLQATSNLPTVNNSDSSVNWNNADYANCSFNKGQDLVISQALIELGITDDTLQSSSISDHGKIWHCPRQDCARKFTRLYALKCHLLTHYGVRPFKCDFDGCTWSFFSEFKLKRHKETHLKKKDYICKIAGCERQFTTIYNLWSHEKLHSRPSKIMCHVPNCEEKFQTKRALELHMKSHDQSHAPYVCKHEGCEKRYYSNNALTSHQRCHSYKDKDIKCAWPGCSKVFDKPCRLKAHVRSHTGSKPYMCNFQDCQWAFSSSSKLKRHQKKHTNDRKFICDVASCGKAFMRSEHLKEHKLTHNEGRYFHCDLCDSKFSAKSSLYVHIKKQHKKNTTLTPCEKNNKINTSSTALKLHNTNTSPTENKGEDHTDYVYYTDKMIMLTTQCDTVILNNGPAKSDDAVDSIGTIENIEAINTSNEDTLNTLEEEVLQGSARTHLTRSDVSKMKSNTNVQPVVEDEVQETDNILDETDINQGLLFNQDLSSMYYQDVIESTECQVFLLDPNVAESVIHLKDFN